MALSDGKGGLENRGTSPFLRKILPWVASQGLNNG
jgi:hypothetical protein